TARTVATSRDSTAGWMRCQVEGHAGIPTVRSCSCLRHCGCSAASLQATKVLTTLGVPHEPSAQARGRSDQVRRSRAVRRAPARADPPRRLGLPDRQLRIGPCTPAPARPAGGRGLPGARHRAAPLAGQEMSATVLGIAVDPTVGAAIRLAGYDGDFASVEPRGGPQRLVAQRIPGWQAIRFSAATRSIVIPRGVELDLGATAKALASDLAAAAAHNAAGGGVLVSLGGDIAVAGDAPHGGWLVQASEDSASPISDAEETISIANGGVATSGTTVRRWVRGSTVLHHIVDPATGMPAESCWR